MTHFSTVILKALRSCAEQCIWILPSYRDFTPAVVVVQLILHVFVCMFREESDPCISTVFIIRSTKVRISSF